ncbi:MAG: response regulator [Candidatus Hydrogenedentes bacterium]|nr:response regulator [Candidatus Hydrogenedentota bacterium]
MIEDSTKAPGQEGTSLQVALRQVSRRYERLVRELGVLHRVLDLQHGQYPLDYLSREILRFITDGGAAEHASFMFLSHDQRTLVLQAVSSQLEKDSFYLAPGEWNGRQFSLGEGIAGRVALTGQAIRIQNVDQEEQFLQSGDGGIRIKSMLCLPVLHNDMLLGVLNLSHSREAFFQPDSERIMGMVARAAAIMLRDPLRIQWNDQLAHRFTPDELDELFVTLNDRHQIVAANASAVRKLGLEDLEDPGKALRWTDRIHPDDLRHCEMVLAQAQGLQHPITFDFRVLMRDGKAVAHHGHVIPVSRVSGTPCSFFILAAPSDIAQPTSMENLRNEAHILQVQRIEALGLLANGLAHDLNNVLTGIIGNLDLASLACADEQTGRLMLEARNAGLRGAEMLNQLLSFSQINRGVAEATEPAPILESTARLLKSLVSAPVEIDLRLGADRAHVLGDPNQIHQVLLNVCMNAKEAVEKRLASEPGAPARITLGVEGMEVLAGENRRPWAGRAAGKYAHLFVRDTGAGMEEAVRYRVFEPFFTTKAPGTGLGLGLTTVSALMKQQGGWVDVESLPGQGTTVSLYFREARFLVEPTVAPAEPKPGAKKLILLIDDETMLLKLGKTLLQRLGYNVLVAEDGESGLALYQQYGGRVDLVISDVTLPGMTGLEVLKALRKDCPSLPVILSSGYNIEQIEDGMEGCIPNGFLRKPFLIGTIQQMLEECLSGGSTRTLE